MSQRATTSDTEKLLNDDPVEIMLISNNLYELYIENTDANPQLKNLLDKNDKVVFQFYRGRDGVLGLTAWPGKKGNTDFDLGQQIRLSRGARVGVNIYREDVHLSDLQLGNKLAANLKKILRDHHNDPNYKFIYFVPQIKRDDTYHLNHVVYSIEARSEDEQTITGATVIDIGFANPSPPRKVDEDL